MRALSLSILGYSLTWFAQATVNSDDLSLLFSVWDKYGFPVIVAIAMFVYFQRQLTKSNDDKDNYRGQMIALLERLLGEAQTSNKLACKFEKSEN